MIRTGKKCLIALLLLVMTLWTTTAMAASGTVKVTSLVLREEASSKSDALQTLPKGSEVTIVYKDGSWYKVKYGRYTGFVMTRYISTDDDVPTRDEVEGLQVGSSGSKVKTLQRRLKELGYYTGSIDGSFGAKTEDAVKAFQKRNGLTADGVVGEATQKKLDSSSAKPASSSSSSSSGSSSSGSSSSGSVDTDETLRVGSTGSAVKAVQRRLKELGYYTGSVDGAYGSGTATAVRAFQKRNKLTVDGTVGPSTLKALNSSSAKPAKPAEDDDDEEDDNSSSSSGAFDSDGNLTVGSRGEVVKTLQNKLKSLGYYKKSVDGIYGTGTVEAVKAFQKRNNLTADGVAGEATLRVLYSSSAKPAGDDDEDEDEDDSTVESSSGLRAGDRGSEVKALQRRLKELGYYKNSIDGSYGTLTEAAVKAFQKNNKLTVDGIAGAATIKKLNSSSAVTASGGKLDDDDDDDDQEESSSSSSQYDTLRPGATGTAVKEMQYRLKELGYYSGSRDGVYGSGTRAAVMSFQTVNGLTVDGIAGSATLKKLYSSDAKRANSSSGSGSGSGSGSSGGSSGTVDLSDVKEAINPGDKGEAVKALQTRLKELGYYTNTIDGEYGYGTRQAVLAFQKNNGLTQDGIAGLATLKKMVSSSAVGKDDVEEGTYVTERLDWFNGGASKIPRGAIFQIKDVRTGRVFTGKRQGGSYHMDVEPLTAADTAILLKINGGVDYSWRRRPMLVLYNGHVYACSIYSEPHGSDTIPGNNFDGQFCLHFYGSMTHGTDRVDEDHQACEAQALKATW